MSAPRSDETSPRWTTRARSTIALAVVIAGAGALLLFGRGDHASRAGESTRGAESAAARATPAPAGAFTGNMSTHAPPPPGAPAASPPTASPPAALPPAAGTSVVSRLMARYRPEDLELLSAVSRRTSAPPPPAVHRLIDAARRGADDAELTGIIRDDVPGALVRHDCFDWLRKRRGAPPPKAPSLASRVRARPAR